MESGGIGGMKVEEMRRSSQEGSEDEGGSGLGKG